MRNNETVQNYKRVSAKLRRIYRDALRDVRYWYKIERRFDALCAKRDAFSITFPHLRCKDSIRKIRTIANRHGFMIYEESRTAHNSIVFFKRKELKV